MSYYNPGIYRFQIENQAFGKSEKKGTPFFCLEGKPTSMLDADRQEQPVTSYQRTIIWYITDNTVERVLEDLRKLGFVGAKFSDLDPSNGSCYSFVGQEIWAECKHEPGIGDQASKLFEKWQLPYEPAKNEPTVNDTSVSKRLDAMFGKKLKPAPKPATTTDLAKEAAAMGADGIDSPF